MKNFLRRMGNDFVSRIILLALIILAYFIVVWIFPELEYHGPANGRERLFIPLIYAFGFFSAMAIAAAILFVVGAILIGAVMVFFQRDNA